ncbi:hexitol phosphatase HxpB [Aliiglaciecola sp. CAU 1673]|uniref:hexitol phosphatase HxpB n=1 Tax=Aliiglaciecola sp. CAU 1673 TaxID=3032595 RepID=UPI0023DBC311|nr:hexitol phosphatase HxpB [Aliiglaciecola sp. CAU 1673]MDF2178691.1 hexitol phosphatase HxpB [Aliiglaciecola sp. CAU 1673]
MAEKLKAIVFDMDGLLIDSEPLWRQAEQELFRTLGVHLDEQMCRQTTGLSTEEVVSYWYQRYPWENANIKSLARALEERVIELVIEKGQAMPGTYELIAHCLAQNHILAVASGSVSRIIETVLDKLMLRDAISLFHSAEHEVRGKPDPAVYLGTLKRLGISANQAIAFEDSLPGVKAAIAAGLFTVAVPDIQAERAPFAIADVVVNDLYAAIHLPMLRPPHPKQL